MANGKSGGVDMGLLVLRLALGGIFIAHGVGKLLAPKGVQGFADFLASLSLPLVAGNLIYPLAVAVVSAEIGGGLLVILGLFARLGGLALAILMAVAIWKVHFANGFFLPLEAKGPGPIAQGYEYNVALLAMALCILLAGPGQIAFAPPRKGGKGDKPA